MPKLGDVCLKITDGSHNPPSGIEQSDYLMISSKNIDDGLITLDSPRYLSQQDYIAENKRTSISPDDLLMTIVGTIGRIAVVPQNFGNICVQRSVAVIKPDSSKIDSRYLMYHIQALRCSLEKEAHGVAQKGLYLKQVEQIDITIPDMSRQLSICKILDEVNDLIALRMRQLEKLDKLVKARFVEMFGDPVRNEKGWPVTPLGNVAEIKIGPFGSLLHKEEYIEGGHALVNPSHIIDSKICIDNKLTISQKKYEELYAYQLMPGDIVLGRRGEMGRCAIVYKEGLLCGTGSMILRVDGKIVRPYFLQAILSSPTYKKYIEDSAVGVTMQNLNVPIVSSLMIPLYPPEKQVEYSNLLYHTDMDKNTVRKSIQALEKLKSALMQEYFG